MEFVEILSVVTLADDRKEVRVREVPVVAEVDTALMTVRVLTNREDI